MLQLIPEKEIPVLHIQNKITKSALQIPLQEMKDRLDEVPFEKLTNAATLPDYNEPGPKLEISGVVYQRDGKTPAKDVVVYVYHTDQTGHYTPASDAKGWGKRHGRIRGWVKTDKNGFYHF